MTRQHEREKPTVNLDMENEATEHKRSTAELEAAMESVASILNKHDHGELYFGVRPRDGEVVGMDVSEKTLRDISQAFTNRVEPRVYPTIEHLVTENGKSYVKASFSGTERPYASHGRYRIRSAGEDPPMNAETLERIMLERAERKGPGTGAPQAGRSPTRMRARCAASWRKATPAEG